MAGDEPDFKKLTGVLSERKESQKESHEKDKKISGGSASFIFT